MNRYPWFRLYAEARTDAKLRTLTDAQFRVWFNLLCYASEQDERGTIPPTDPFLLAVEVASGDEALLTATLARLVSLRMIDTATPADALTFTKFTERQYDKPSDAPDATRERKARQREKERESRVTIDKSRPLSRGVTRCHAPEKSRGDESKEEKSIGSGTARAARATPAPDSFPLTADMRSWADEHAPGVDVDTETTRFLDRNRATGTTYRDWTAAWRNWLTSPYAKPPPPRPNGRAPNGSAGFTSDDAFAKNMAKLKAVGRR